MSLRDEWLEVNQTLEAICQDLLKHLPSTGPTDNRFCDFMTGFLRKATRLLTASNTLAQVNLWDETQIIARVLLEHRINVDYFMKQANDSIDVACRAVQDAWVLQRIKEWETSRWMGVSPEVKDFYTAQIKRLNEDWTPAQIKLMRLHGFSQLSVEARAKATGHDDAYQMIYRRFGRPIHSTDYAEYLAGPTSIVDEELQYRNWRDPMIAYVIHFSAGGIAELTNAYCLSRSHDFQLDEIGKRQKGLRMRQESAH
ncbi:MAG: hypothetical protein HW388_270 [Dehalococcoidia bacterium]|nr:hypothetical protein [Dehalococcoidia bacterium]